MLARGNAETREWPDLVECAEMVGGELGQSRRGARQRGGLLRGEVAQEFGRGAGEELGIAEGEFRGDSIRVSGFLPKLGGGGVSR
jgi:hypothetical protein